MQVFQEFSLFEKKHLIHAEGDKLIITSPSGSAARPETLFEVWLRNEAKKYIPFRAAEIARRENLIFKNISIKGQRTRWGSCSARKTLSFNYRLMRHRKEVIDYVIIHELCHLKELNHSKKFWQLVEGMCPSARELKKELLHGH
jgi:predicted metal-dependent hydrolase